MDRIRKALQRLRLFGTSAIEERDDWTAAEQAQSERVREEVIRRTWQTGVPHYANQRRDGSWEIRPVGS